MLFCPKSNGLYRKVWRNQRGNQKPYFEEGHTIQQQKEKDRQYNSQKKRTKRHKQWSTWHHIENKRLSNMTPHRKQKIE